MVATPRMEAEIGFIEKEATVRKKKTAAPHLPTSLCYGAMIENITWRGLP